MSRQQFYSSGCEIDRGNVLGGHARVIRLIVACFLAGLAAGAFWIFRNPSSPASDAVNQPGALSATTQTLLERLEAPVEIRFYSVLTPASVTENDQALAGRVEALLSEYQKAAQGKLKFTRFSSAANASDAVTDGITEFNADKGDPCFFGIVVTYKGKKETLSHISPEWEAALEPDLTRAIARLVQASTPTPVPSAPKSDTAVIEEVKRLIPNFSSVSLEEGTRVIREAGLAEFKSTTIDFQKKIKEAEQSLVQAQNGGSEADQQAALKQLQQLQAEQIQRLKQIAARSKAQTDALQQLKAGSH